MTESGARPMPADALSWLAAHDADVPPSLHARMRDALRERQAHADAQLDGTGALTESMAGAAVDCLRDALRAGDDRAAALHLLAADALVTWACALAADDGAAALAALADQLSPARLAALAAESDG